MADNVGYTPGTGETIATDDIGGVQYQRIKVTTGGDGVATDVSDANPMPVAAYGELIEAIESMRFAINQLTKSIGFALPNTSGQPIVEVRQGTAGNLLISAQQNGTWNVTTTNQTLLGGFNTNDQIPALMHIQADGLRQNISVT